MRRITVLACAVLATLLVLAACGGDRKGALASIPANATILGSVQPKRTLQDKQLQDVFATAAKDTPFGVTGLDFVVTALEKQTGVDLRQIDEITLAFVGDPVGAGMAATGGSGMAPEITRVVFFKGSFDQAKIIESMKRGSGRTVNTMSYKGQDVLSPDESTAVAFLQEDLLAIGNQAGVKAAIDVRKGDAPAISGRFVNSFKNLRDPLVKVSVAVPKDAIRNAIKGGTGNGPIQIDPQLFEQVNTIGFTLSKQGQKIAMTLAVDYPTADDARRAREGFNGLLQFFKAFGGKALEGQKGLNKAFDSVRITNLGSQLNVTLFLTPADLKDAIEGINTLASSLGGLGGMMGGGNLPGKRPFGP